MAFSKAYFFINWNGLIPEVGVEGSILPFQIVLKTPMVMLY